eukprot:SAG31_NODE_5797_length_2323_cov_3.180842_5_plen_88_part_00
MKCQSGMEVLFAGLDLDHIHWVVRFTTTVARTVLLDTDTEQRRQIVAELSGGWPDSMFLKLVRLVGSVADATVVHIVRLQHHTKLVS